jgi:hypothetical protein
MIKKLKKNQIFVFGSNLSGHHAGGAALQAKQDFGAEEGVGEGLTGNCYAFPTLTKTMEKVSMEALEASRDELFKCCEENKNSLFLLTKVGCGIAGFKEEEIKNLFIYDTPKNLVLPDGWNRRLFKFLRTGMKSEKGDCTWKIGEEKIGKNPKCCEAGGYHASTKIIDALRYVQGEILAEVEVSGISDWESDKQCWERMTIIHAKDWTPTDSIKLTIFSAEQVIDIFEAWNKDDKRPRNAIEVAKNYLANPTNKKAADAACAAARAADAACAAARAADAAYAARAADAAYAAARAAADAAYAAAYAVYAACAAYAAARAAADAAYAAAYAVYAACAAYAAARAAADAAYAAYVANAVQNTIEKYIRQEFFKK